MLTKQAVDIPFAQGLDTKTDPKRVQMGKFLRLENSIFDKGGLLQKRNGYAQLSSLPDTTYSYLTTFHDNLTALGQNVAAYNAPNASWVSKGTLEPLSMLTLPVIRNNLNQTKCDVAIASNGLACAAYLESDGSTTTAKYVVFDSVTGQNISAPRAIPVSSGTVTGGMRVFVLENNFIILFTNVITAVNHLQYIAVNIADPSVVRANTDIASNYAATATLSYDAVVVGRNLYISYYTTSGGSALKMTYLTSSFVVATPLSKAGYVSTMTGVTADMTNPASPVIYVGFYDSGSGNGYILAIDTNLGLLMDRQIIINGLTVLNLTVVAQSGACTSYFERDNGYGYDGGIKTNFIQSVTVTLSGPATSATTTIIRSVGLASKAFIIDDSYYFLAAYKSTYQPTYFLIKGTSLSSSPVVAAKLAYENGGGYLTTGLPNVTVTDNVAQFPYLFKDLIQAVNKNTAVVAGTQTSGIYSQTGINLATFTFGTDGQDASEIGSDLHLTGGFLWMYDGYLPVEHNFFLWPDTDYSSVTTVIASWSAAGGSIVAKPDAATNTNAYYYQFTYEWTDNQGNAFRSAPSIPIPVTTTGAGTTGSITLNIPTLRLTMKTANPVKIVIYRWSVGQQNYYQVTSITSPTLNSTTTDSITYLDTLADASILGNNLLYTTGGVVEDMNAPASDLLALFDTRLWLVDAEDRNLLWFSKQVIEATPVEMSDLFTKFIPPVSATQVTTGPITSISPMDDKLIIGKKNAFVYINGTGPDNTGANNQYSEPIFITSTVGCDNQKSIVLMPKGLMFQSNKGIWLLDRGLGTSYIGAPVQDFVNGATVTSAVTVPETNQVRFTLDSGITLMYDYFYDQWGVFTGVPCVASCIFDDLHTFINSSGAVYQESVGTYLDGSNPVLMAFETGPIRLGDLQGYQRAYFFYLLGTYLSPHKLVLSIAYDYSMSPSQVVVISPINYNPPYGSGGSQSPYGQGNPYGGPSNAEDWRIFLERQRCMAFSLTLQEIFDASLGAAAGAGFTLSGINAVCAVKKGYRPQPAAITAG